MTERELLEDIELELVRARAGSAPIRSRHTLAACDLLLELVRDRLHDYYESARSAVGGMARRCSMPASELSKRDADALGVADMTGSQLRARVFQVEGLMCELALVVEEMLRRFAPDDDGLGEAEIMCAERAREAAASVRERYGAPQYDAHEEADELDELHDLGVVVLAGPPLKPKRLTLDEARAEFDRRQVAATITDAELAAARRGEGDR